MAHIIVNNPLMLGILATELNGASFRLISEEEALKLVGGEIPDSYLEVWDLSYKIMAADLIREFRERGHFDYAMSLEHFASKHDVPVTMLPKNACSVQRDN